MLFVIGKYRDWIHTLNEALNLYKSGYRMWHPEDIFNEKIICKIHIYTYMYAYQILTSVYKRRNFLQKNTNTGLLQNKITTTKKPTHRSKN